MSEPSAIIVAMLVPIIIFVVCFGGGAAAAGHWLPDLGASRVAGLAFFAVCGLLGAALAIVGLNVYEMVKGLGGFEETKAEILAGELRYTLLEAGTLFGLAAIVYLIAPQAHRERSAGHAPGAAAETAQLP